MVRGALFARVPQGRCEGTGVSIEEAKSRIYRSAADAMIAQLEDYLEFFKKRANLGSPIEELFLTGFLAATHAREGAFINAEFNWHIEHAQKCLGDIGLCLKSQYKVDNFRVDFVLNAAMVSGTIDGADIVKQSCIAIECDGAAFHHGNAKAAARDKARDRVLAERFDAILRFTGAELHANAYSCAEQAIRVAEAKLI